jgi:hypothetical protein
MVKYLRSEILLLKNSSEESTAENSVCRRRYSKYSPLHFNYDILAVAGVYSEYCLNFHFLEMK